MEELVDDHVLDSSTSTSIGVDDEEPLVLFVLFALFLFPCPCSDPYASSVGRVESFVLMNTFFSTVSLVRMRLKARHEKTRDSLKSSTNSYSWLIEGG